MRHFQYYSCTTTQHSPARTPNEAHPVLKLYYNPAQSSQDTKRGISSTKVVLQTKHNPTSQDPKQGISSTKVVLQPSTMQPGPQTRHFQY